MLERRDQIGGACTLEEPFGEGYLVSPCAYVVGLLENLVIDELELRKRGLRFFTADPNLWVPFEDGTAFGQFLDDEKTKANLDALGVSEADQKGYWAYEELFDETRIKLRKGERDTWVGDTPTRAQIEEILDNQEMIDLVFEDSIAEVLDRYIGNEKLKTALYGQGVIGTWGGPYEPGTASIKLMHYQGDLEGQGPVWGYVEGGMGMVSFAIADAALEAGAQIACGVEVAGIVPGEGVVCEDGTMIRARNVVSNADPKRTLGMLEADSGGGIDGAFKSRLDAWKIRSPVVKFNAALSRLPQWAAAPGESWPAQATIDACGTMDEAQAAFERCAAGEPAVAFAEIYIQTGYDPTVAPEGKHLMSVFGQYAPYDISGSDWDAARDGVAGQFIDLISRFAPDFGDVHHRSRSARPARHRVESRTDRRQHLPGGGDPRPDVGGQAFFPDPDAGALHVGSRHTPGRQRDRPERPERRRSGAGGRRHEDRSDSQLTTEAPDQRPRPDPRGGLRLDRRGRDR